MNFILSNNLMTNINFYCIDDDINYFIFELLNGMVKKNNKVLIYSPNEEKIQELDKMLWTLKKISFLPHLINTDKNANITPIVITNQLENINNANILFTSKYIENNIFLNDFEKVIFFFSTMSIESIDNAKLVWEKYKEHNLKFYRKDGSKWVEKNEFLL